MAKFVVYTKNEAPNNVQYVEADKIVLRDRVIELALQSGVVVAAVPIDSAYLVSYSERTTE